MLQDHLLNSTAKRVRILRIHKGLNQTEVEKALNEKGFLVKSGYLSNIESKDALPSTRLLVALAQILGCSTDYLLLLTDDPAPVHPSPEVEYA